MTLREDQFIERGNGLEVNGEAWLVEIIFFFFLSYNSGNIFIFFYEK